jgi:hypothetical protein
MIGILDNDNLKSILIEFNDINNFIEWEKVFNSKGLFMDYSFDNIPNNSGIRRSLKGSKTRNYIFQRK